MLSLVCRSVGRHSVPASRNFSAVSTNVIDPKDELDESYPAAPKGSAKPSAFDTTSFNFNGIPAVCAENRSFPISTVSFIFKAGTKYEGYGQTGLVQTLKYLAFADNENYSAVGVSRFAEQKGANVTTSYNRDFFAVTVECLRSNVVDLLDLSSSIVVHPKFSYHRTAYVAKQIAEENARLSQDPVKNMVDALYLNGYRGAYTHPLSSQPPVFENSVLKDFHSSHFVRDNMAIVATGVDEDNLRSALQLSEISELSAAAPAATPSIKYVGGTAQITPTSDGVSRYMRAFNTQGRDTSLATQLAIFALSGAPAFGRSRGAGVSPLSNAMGKTGASLATFNFNDLSTGLAGYLIQAPASGDINGAVQAAQAAFESTIDAESLARAKQQLKMSVANSRDNQTDLVHDLASQVMAGKNIDTTKTIFSQIDQVAAADVAAAAKQLANSTPTTVLSGNFH